MSLNEFQPVYFDFNVQGDVAVARFTVPQLTDEQNIEQLGRDLFALVDQYAQRKVILCLEQVQFLTSSVLGKLISLHRKMHRSQGKLVLCELSPQVREVLQLSRLVDYFNTTDTVAQALVLVQQSA